MNTLTPDQIRERREAMESALPGTRWFTPRSLSERWGVSVTTVRGIPLEQLRYKEFGNGDKLKLRRYRADWVSAYEESTGRTEHAA